MLTKNSCILFTGDSITDCGRDRQNKDSAGHGYVNLIKSHLMFMQPESNFAVHNTGISGNRIVDLYARLKEDCYNIQPTPNVVSILIGINDVWHEYANNQGVEAEKFWRMYDIMLGEIDGRLPGVKLVMMEPFVLGGGLPIGDYGAWREELAIRQSIIKNLAEEYSAVYIPLQSLFDAACYNAPDIYWLYDGIHPTAAGHALIADAWQKAVLK